MGQPCCLGGEVGALQCWTGAGRVALVEDEIEDVHHHAESVGALWFRRQVEVCAAAPDALLGTADALRHRGFRNQEGARDLSGREAADCTQRQRELRRHRQGWVAAHE